MNPAHRLEEDFETSEEILAEAEQHVAAGRLSKAEEIFASQCECDIEHRPRALMGLAHCAVARHCVHEALGHLQELQNIDPHYPSLDNDFGVVYYQLGLVDQARASFDRAVREDASHLEAWRNLLHIALEMRDANACVEASQRILGQDPSDPTARAIMDAAASESIAAAGF